MGLKIGLTKFKEFRPRNVILAGASGSHNVCVCTTHQNVKLMIEGSKVLTLEGIRRMCGEMGTSLTNTCLPACCANQPSQLVTWVLVHCVVTSNQLQISAVTVIETRNALHALKLHI